MGEGLKMRVLLAYSSKTKNTKKVALAMYENIKDKYTVDIFDIRKSCKTISRI